ncbi:3-hydroxyacyl-CoA dehydrogenase [Patulibacter defluvii]|uniref:3-hydroxyacyl-CoA dehydrogenase n=1 Tax=Patulibacter defluvii TaxID=3095358 RepID=UPI002A7505B7|nr:3-hydroxyacyl-CoA dehydrogenase NAD-binding domain-containing protein [Patulibacter sp. DM4]
MSALEGPLAVVGGGTMGAGIALLAALHDQRATVLESDADDAAAARERLEGTIARRVERGSLDGEQAAAVAARIAVVSDHADAPEPVAVIEAVPEILDLKRTVLARAAAAWPRATLASNTSSIPIAEIAAGLDAPERVVGLHFFNPPTEMALVELVTPPGADPAHVATARRVADALGRTVVEAADAPGFVVNRCARPYYLEALRVLEQGLADVAAVDGACEAAGFPLGPFALMDLIGIDVSLAVTRSMWERGDHEPRWRPSPLQERQVADGELGRKSGRGFHAYGDGAPRRERVRPADRLVAAEEAADRAGTAIDALLAGGAPPAADLALARILVQLVNEARFARAEGVATADAIDVGMTVGLNHPVGPSRWAAWIGAARVDGFLDRLAGPDHDPVYRRPDPAAVTAEEAR